MQRSAPVAVNCFKLGSEVKETRDQAFVGKLDAHGVVQHRALCVVREKHERRLGHGQLVRTLHIVQVHCIVQRCEPSLVLCHGIGARLQEQTHNVWAAALASQMKRGLALIILRLDAGAETNEEFNENLMTAHTRNMQRHHLGLLVRSLQQMVRTELLQQHLAASEVTKLDYL